MTVDDPDIMRPSLMPPETDPPLLIDPDAVLATPIALQSLEPVARRHAQISQQACLIEHAQLAQRRRLDVER
jgi:hypothetical protein